MPKRRDILAIILIVLPWTLLVTVWHQSTIAPLLTAHKGEPPPRPPLRLGRVSVTRVSTAHAGGALISTYPLTRQLGGAIRRMQANNLTLLGVLAPLGIR